MTTVFVLVKKERCWNIDNTIYVRDWDDQKESLETFLDREFPTDPNTRRQAKTLTKLKEETSWWICTEDTYPSA